MTGLPNLTGLLEAATPGEWDVNEWFFPDDDRLIAAAPSLAALLIDAEQALREIVEYFDCLNPDECGGRIGTCRVCSGRGTLARFVAFDAGLGETT